MLDVTIVMGTFGDRSWSERARALSHRMIAAHPGVATVVCHRDTLAAARNDGARAALTEWLCFLDADDELEPGYFDVSGGDWDILVPRVRYVGSEVRDGSPPRRVRVAGHGTQHAGDCAPDCLGDGNYIVVGAPLRRALFNEVGGFRDLPVYEDYDLWVRCWRAGALIAYTDGQVYRAHVNPRGRNVSLTAAERRKVEAGIRLHRDPVS